MMNIKQRIASYTEEMKANLFRLVRIPSVEAQGEEGCPFGPQAARALQETLSLGGELGFRTKNLDNYAGYIEFGEGEDLIGILCHVDVVPAGEGWSSDPFAPYEKEGLLYGRGTADDKGPLVCALYAMKILKDMGITPQKRVRLIVGANEESGSRCMEHYKKVEEAPTMGFSPDASFPLIFGEKSILNLTYTFKNENASAVKLLRIDGGAAANVVCPKASAVLGSTQKEAAEIEQSFNSYLASKGLGGEARPCEEGIKLTLLGVNAHASTPEEGINAIAYLCEYLAGVCENNVVAYINKYFGLSWGLENHGLNCHDSYGSATCNLGVIETAENKITLTIDIRYPITLSFEETIKAMQKTAEEAGAQLKVNAASPALFVDPESPLVKALYKAYVSVTGDKVNKPITIGGGTYCRAFKNTVAFGCEMPGGVYRAHMSDEYISVADMVISTEIFIKAIEALLAL